MQRKETIFKINVAKKLLTMRISCVLFCDSFCVYVFNFHKNTFNIFDFVMNYVIGIKSMLADYKVASLEQLSRSYRNYACKNKRKEDYNIYFTNYLFTTIFNAIRISNVIS